MLLQSICNALIKHGLHPSTSITADGIIINNTLRNLI